MPEPNTRKVLVAIDGSKYSEKAFDCKYNFSTAFRHRFKICNRKTRSLSSRDSGQLLDNKFHNLSLSTGRTRRAKNCDMSNLDKYSSDPEIVFC